ncbi:protein kinase domain-containing protein [Streptomyces buecherae]|uniref:protein kinase domain-containing protein n=1 Tax=Streptomyces buecherae TaxID=2763006 RepID=UPI00365911F4
MEDLGADDPRWIGEYRLLSRLGEGGMGRVYLARSARGRTVAVKLVRGELASQSDFRRRFQAEVRAAQRVGGDWTAPVLDADTEAATPWVATGYIGGPSLHDVVTEDHGPLPENSVRALARGLALALRDIHGAGLIHRDLKPSNVLITIDGPRVIDFGIARALDSVGDTGLTMTGAVVGSPGFMSPEQVRGDPITAASDLFCLGSVLAFAATGRSPFGTVDSGVHALMYRVAQEAPDLTGLPEGLRELIDGCLTKDPASRFTLDQVLAHAGGAGPDGAGALAAGQVGGGDAGPWLPGELLARLGRDALRLLEAEMPQTGVGFAPLGGATPPGGQPPARPQTPGTPPPSTPPGTQFGPPIPPGPQISGQPPMTTTHAAYAGQPTMGPHAGHPHTGVAAPLYPTTHVGYRPPAVWRSPRGLANATVVLFSIGLLIMLMDLIFSLRLYGTYDDFFSDTVDSTALEDDEGVTEGFDALWFFLSIPMVVLWVIWFRRVYVNAQALAPGRQRFSSGLAAGAWFIPVVQFWFPKQMANDVWTTSAPPTPAGYPPQPGTGRGLLNTWWVLFLAMLVTNTISFFVFADAETYGEHQTSVAWSVFADVVSIPCAVFAIAVVVRLSALQERRVTGQPMPGQGAGPGGYGSPYGPGLR